jgi:hypothetical protein
MIYVRLAWPNRVIHAISHYVYYLFLLDFLFTPGKGPRGEGNN